MDLAKIRKKSLSQTEQSGDYFASPSTPLELFESESEMVPAASVLPVTVVTRNESDRETVALIEPVTLLTPAQLPHHSPAVTRSPLEAILAGRSAAGCDEEAIRVVDDTSETVADSRLEFLCFRVSNEVYGINIMDIKEIIKPREVTEVPRAPVFVSGIMSLRGTIIPIIDMRIRLGLAREEQTGKERIIVIKNNNTFSGLLVDEVIQVVKVQLDAVEAAPTVLDGIDRDFISGLGRSDGRLIILLHLENIADINLY